MLLPALIFVIHIFSKAQLHFYGEMVLVLLSLWTFNNGILKLFHAYLPYQ